MRPIDVTFKSYLEGKLVTLNQLKTQQEHTIWLKPNIVAPQGYSMWIASLVRKISVVPRLEFLQQ